MPIEKNTQMKIKNNSGEWIYLYPKTKMEQVDGLSVELSLMKNKLTELLYTLPSISTFIPENNILNYEKGQTINSIKLIWSYNKTITSQLFNNTTTLSSNVREYTYTTPFSINTSFSLTASDGKNSTSKNCTISFLSGKYFGVSNLETLDSTSIKTLTKVLNENKAHTFTVVSNATEYIYYCIPSRLGNPMFTVGGFTGGFSKIQVIDYTNSYDFTERYDIWRSTNKGLGNTTIIAT